MPGPVHLIPPPPPTLASAQGASYVHTPDWKPGPMAPAPAYQYPNVWKKNKAKKK